MSAPAWWLERSIAKEGGGGWRNVVKVNQQALMNGLMRALRDKKETKEELLGYQNWMTSTLAPF